MIKITVAKGYWEREMRYTTLVHEPCRNKSCPESSQNLHYPLEFLSVTCPKCETSLVGHYLAKERRHRITYHLEGKLPWVKD